MKIKVLNRDEKNRIQEPVTVGIPCPKGIIFPGQKVEFEGSGKRFPVQAVLLTCWPDKSAKWLLCDFLVDILPGESFYLQLQKTDVEPEEIEICHLDESVEINTGVAMFSINTRTLFPYNRVEVNSKTVLKEEKPRVWITDQVNQRKFFHIKAFEVERSGPVRLTLLLKGVLEQEESIEFDARINVYNGTAKSSIDLTLRNSRAAKHPGGIWDLGDPASFLFKEFVVSLLPTLGGDFANKFRITPDEPWHSCDENSNFQIYQEASGGEFWDSPNHRNSEGNVPMKIDGYQIFHNSIEIARGKRAQPVSWMGSLSGGISVVVPRFWQEFPKAIELSCSGVNISLFPASFPALHELQGGEQKTHTLYFDFDVEEDHSGWGLPSLQIIHDPDSVNAIGIFPQLASISEPDERYAKFSRAALEGKQSFIRKREVVDEYGWRNFGELYADHESVYNTTERPFVSHYNNQYDPLFNFYREFFQSGNQKWKELADDLARHCLDIDLNHTDLDREEYCHGLFWHTDHYLDAGLSTHRCVSKEHLDKKNPAVVGGGPGAQHCYTSGLMYSYLITGNTLYREAVLRLANWSYIALTGPQTILAALLRSVRMLKKHINGNMKQFTSRYPLDRGTGNCLNAFLDAYGLTQDRKYLDTAIDLIKGVIHPADNIEDRNLLNAEESWSYTVLLVSVCKFLKVKEEISEIDDDFNYAKSSLLHYAIWMVENEIFYLDHSVMLEYPNETWAAQELRKCVVLYYAAQYADDKTRAHLLRKCRQFVDKSFISLDSYETSFLTRPLVLTMQNGWVADAIKNDMKSVSEMEVGRSENLPTRNNRNAIILILHNIALDIFNSAKVTDLRREWKWLRSRLEL